MALSLREFVPVRRTRHTQLLRLAVSYAALRHLRVCVRACVREAGERAHTPPRFVSLLPNGRHVTPVTWYSCPG